MERLRVIERHLLPLVLATTVLGLGVPGVGQALSGAITPLLALLMLCVSLTFDWRALRAVLARPGVQAVATGLVYGPMSLAGFAIGRLFFGQGPLGLGLTLVGTLPTDVSSPLLVWIARGNVALATVLNAVNTALAPFLVPALFLMLTGIELEVPVGALVGELALTVLAPTALGVTVRTLAPWRVAPVEPALSAVSSISYLALLLAVVGPNAEAVVDAPLQMMVLASAVLVLNVVGYGLGLAARPLLPERGDRVAMLFTVSKKEFSIAAFVVFASGLPADVALPAAVYAVVQMLTSPVVAAVVKRRSG